MGTQCFSFGPFVLIPERQVLLRSGVPVRLGARALDILTLLVRRAGEMLEKQEIISRVWTDTFVDDSNLKVNIAAIRKAIDTGDAMMSCIATVIGRGYKFVEPVQIVHADRQFERSRYPGALNNSSMRLLGRNTIVAQLTDQLDKYRLITIVGFPGVGKSSVAMAVAEIFGKNLESGACLIDCSMMSRSGSLTQIVSAALGLEAESASCMKHLIDHLMDKEMVLLLDNCECAIEASANFAELVQVRCPRIRILATSQEPLGVCDEKLCRLRGLEIPSTGTWFNASELRNFAAVELFLERAMETAGEFTATDKEISAITDICRELDGIPLAIELAAMRVRALGFSGLPSIRSNQFFSFCTARRTGLWRHRSIGACIEWSFRTLSDSEILVLQRLSSLEGWFDLEMAVGACSTSDMSTFESTTCIANLVSKSLLDKVEEGLTGFRLPQIVRIYTSLKLISSNGPRCSISLTQPVWKGFPHNISRLPAMIEKVS